MKRLLAISLLLLSPLARSAEYAFDKVHTQILFTVSHLGFSNSTGAFTEFDGGFVFDENNLEASSVNVSISTKSIDMNDKTWNQHLSGEKWFDVKQFPTMSFKSTGVTKTGDKTMDVKGDLTIKGVTKPVTLAVIFNKAGDQFGKAKAGFSATTSIDRTEFGMPNNAPAIGAQVTIRIEVEGVKQ